MMVYMDYPKESTKKKISELISEDIKVTGYKINIKNLTVFL